MDKYNGCAIYYFLMIDEFTRWNVLNGPFKHVVLFCLVPNDVEKVQVWWKNITLYTSCFLQIQKKQLCNNSESDEIKYYCRISDKRTNKIIYMQLFYF